MCVSRSDKRVTKCQFGHSVLLIPTESAIKFQKSAFLTPKWSWVVVLVESTFWKWSWEDLHCFSQTQSRLSFLKCVLKVISVKWAMTLWAVRIWHNTRRPTMWENQKQYIDQMTPRWCFLQISRDLSSQGTLSPFCQGQRVGNTYDVPLPNWHHLCLSICLCVMTVLLWQIIIIIIISSSSIITIITIITIIIIISLYLCVCVCVCLLQEEAVSVKKVTYREDRFGKFASVAYEGTFYMTPQDFLESITEESPRRKSFILRLQTVWSENEANCDKSHFSIYFYMGLNRLWSVIWDTLSVVGYLVYGRPLCLTAAREKSAVTLFNTPAFSQFDLWAGLHDNSPGDINTAKVEESPHVSCNSA